MRNKKNLASTFDLLFLTALTRVGVYPRKDYRFSWSSHRTLPPRFCRRWYPWSSFMARYGYDWYGKHQQVLPLPFSCSCHCRTSEKRSQKKCREEKSRSQKGTSFWVAEKTLDLSVVCFSEDVHHRLIVWVDRELRLTHPFFWLMMTSIFFPYTW